MRHTIRSRARVRPALAAILFGAALGIPGACSGDQPEAGVAKEIEPPPSLRGEQTGDQHVRLDESQAAELAIEVVAVRLEQAAYPISLPGEVLPAPEHYALVSAPISGRVIQIYAHEGERVRRGQVLLELESLEFANLAAEYLQALAEESYQRSQVERLGTLVERKISPRSALEKATADHVRAETAVSATYARLKAVGVSDETIESWSTTSRGRPTLPVYAPISGVVDRHDVDLGRAVTAYQEMLSVIDVSHVLVRGFVSPDDAPAIAPGDSVYLGVRAAEAPIVASTITTVNPALDEANKSVVVNIRALTSNGWPIPGQTIRLQIMASNPRAAITLPLSAIQYDGEQAAVFVRIDPLTFTKRIVEIERINEDTAIIASGLAEGEEVAVSQIFSLKALSRFELYGED